MDPIPVFPYNKSAREKVKKDHELVLDDTAGITRLRSSYTILWFPTQLKQVNPDLLYGKPNKDIPSYILTEMAVNGELDRSVIIPNHSIFLLVNDGKYDYPSTVPRFVPTARLIPLL